MIIKLPKKDDPFKDDIEKITKELASENIPEVDENEKKERLKKINKSLPKLKNEIKTLIDSLKSDILSCDAKQILDYFAFFYSLVSSKDLIENAGITKLFYLNYILSLVTAIGSINNKDFDEETSERIKETIEKLELQSNLYLMFNAEYNGLADDIKFLQTFHHMNVTGDSYAEHKIQMCRELFSKFDDTLENKYGLTSNELIDELINIAKYPIKNLEIQKKYFTEIMLSHQDFIEKTKTIQSDEELDNFIEKYKESESVKDTNVKLQKIYDNTNISSSDSIFKIHETSVPIELLEKLSIQIGDNINFKEGDIEYFPINSSLIYDKPFIKINDEYYCFNPALIYYNLHSLLESIMLNIIPSNKHQKNFYKKKGEYLEDKSLDLFQQILPNCEVYKNLKYGVDYEVDGIVIYDNHMFIVESKSNKFTLGARQGNIDKIKRNIKDIVEKAYQQAIRAKKYILLNKSVEFRDKNKKVVLTIDREKIQNIYLINTTMEPLNHLSTNLSSLKQFGFIQDDEWIWSVYLNDLRIISEILDSPSEFLVYIERRIKYNDYPQIKMAEEIDIFGYFLSQGLYFDDIDFPENGFMLNIDGTFSKNIDLYYYWKEGSLDEIQEKPSYANECENNIKFLVQQIEDINKKNFSILTKFLLNYDCHTQGMMIEQINLMRKKQRTDFHFYSEVLNIGVVFVVKDIYNYNTLYEKCKLYAYERKINTWFVIIIGKDFLDFEQFYYKNEIDEWLENEVNDLKEYRLEQTLAVNKKIGRNETCPCGSGKKYKRCCLNK